MSLAPLAWLSAADLALNPRRAERLGGMMSGWAYAAIRKAEELTKQKAPDPSRPSRQIPWASGTTSP
jgi:hypothetical protein